MTRSQAIQVYLDLDKAQSVLTWAQENGLLTKEARTPGEEAVSYVGAETYKMARKRLGVPCSE